MMRISLVISTAIGLTAANFLYQFATVADWSLATERSFYQAGALVIACLIDRLRIEIYWRRYAGLTEMEKPK